MSVVAELWLERLWADCEPVALADGGVVVTVAKEVGAFPVICKAEKLLVAAEMVGTAVVAATDETACCERGEMAAGESEVVDDWAGAGGAAWLLGALGASELDDLSWYSSC